MRQFEVEEGGEIIGEPIEAESLEEAQAQALEVHGIVIREMDDPTYEKWLEDNHDRLLDAYEFDIDQMSNAKFEAGRDDGLENVQTFADYARGIYEQELEDKEEDKKGGSER